MKLLSSCFHYRRKGYGTTRVLKVRLGAQGYNQCPGLDFREMFAPVAKFTSIRVLLALAAQQRMRIQQADIDKAYLHADLDEELYMRMPDGVEGPEWNGKVDPDNLALHFPPLVNSEIDTNNPNTPWNRVSSPASFASLIVMPNSAIMIQAACANQMREPRVVPSPASTSSLQSTATRETLEWRWKDEG
ncbi:hypothetical protein JCM1840_007426 [Sporobolomyces johnsonii]